MSRQEPKINLSQKEEEIVILKSTLDIINNIVNYSMMDFLGIPPNEVICKTQENYKLFLILLVDFFSKTSSILHENKSYYEHLIDICKNNANSKDIKRLSDSIFVFGEWISEKIIIKRIRLRSSDEHFDFEISRLDLIQICGNICKHNITNLSRKINKLQNIIGHTKTEASLDDIIASLYELCDIFIHNYIIIQTTIWAELLNNIRIGILCYLKPIFKQSIVYDEYIEGRYYYEYPTYIISALTKEFFWNLMNDVRENFYIKGLKSSEIIKKVNKKQTQY